MSKIDPAEFNYLNWRIIQSDGHITINQLDHMIKMCNNYFKHRTPPKCYLPFRTCLQAEHDPAIAVTCSLDNLKKIEYQHGASFQYLYG